MKSSLRTTTDYSVFDRCKENRPVDLAKRVALRKSIQDHGWIPAYPMHVTRNGKGRLIVRDGQHRLELAKELGLPVWFVECDDAADIAQINNAQKAWAVRDYAASFAQRGNDNYQRILEFSERYKISVSCAASLLAGVVGYSNTRKAYMNGDFKIADEQFAGTVAMIIQSVGRYSKCSKTNAFINAVSACVRVAAFDPRRLIENMNNCPEKLANYSTCDAMLEMLESIYNYAQRNSKLFPLRIEAQKVMRARNPVKKKIA